MSSALREQIVALAVEAVQVHVMIQFPLMDSIHARDAMELHLTGFKMPAQNPRSNTSR